MDISSILYELKGLKDSDRAVRDQAYHKSQREHWGIPVPICDQLARTLCKKVSEKEAVKIALNLWQ